MKFLLKFRNSVSHTLKKIGKICCMEIKDDKLFSVVVHILNSGSFNLFQHLNTKSRLQLAQIL